MRKFTLFSLFGITAVLLLTGCTGGSSDPGDGNGGATGLSLSVVELSCEYLLEQDYPAYGENVYKLEFEMTNNGDSPTEIGAKIGISYVQEGGGEVTDVAGDVLEIAYNTGEKYNFDKIIFTEGLTLPISYRIRYIPLDETFYSRGTVIHEGDTSNCQ